MKVARTAIEGVLLIEPVRHGDDRGFFRETWHAERYRRAGIEAAFVQSNHSRSTGSVLRGLHYQLGRPQAKLVRVARGEVFDVAVDLRRGSPTFGRWEGFVLSGAGGRQLFVPAGCAHGFCVLSETADFLYDCSDYWAPEEERGVRWDDPDLAIAWPGSGHRLSDRDRALPYLRDVPDGDLPLFAPAAPRP